MYLRDTDFPTIEAVGEELAQAFRLKTWGGSSTDVKVSLSTPEEENADESTKASGTITFGKHEIPATEQNLTALATYFEVPYKFLLRVPADEKQFILEHRIQRAADVATTVRWNRHGIQEIVPTSKQRIGIEELFTSIAEHVPEGAMVIDHHVSPAEFRMDIVVPEGYDKYIGGDAKVGDFTHGGIRTGQDRKENTAPWVQPLAFRLACTNGMEFPHPGLRVDARGVDAGDVLMMYRSEIDRAWGMVEKDIEEFYSLREVKVSSDRTGEFRVLAQEQGLPDRIIGRMEDNLAEALLAEEEVSMFHLVNHLTNRANDPDISLTLARNLQIAGGRITHNNAVGHAAERCDMCHRPSRMN